MDMITFPQVSFARNDVRIVARRRAMLNSSVPSALAHYMAPRYPKRSLTQNAHHRSYDYSGTCLHSFICSKEQKERQQRKKKLLPEFNYPARKSVREGNNNLYEAPQSLRGASGSPCNLSFGDLTDFILNQEIKTGFEGAHLDIAAQSNLKESKNEECIGNQVNSNIVLRSTTFGMALRSLNQKFLQVFKIRLMQPWNHPVIQRAPHSFLIPYCLFILHSSMLYFNESPAFAEEALRPSSHIDVVSFEGPSYDLSHKFLNKAMPVATLRSDVGSTISLAVSGLSLSNEHVIASPAASKTMSLFTVAENAARCEETYGIFPCSVTLGGNLFLMLVYGYLLLMAAKFISEGSELLLEVMDPGLIGGLLLPLLGALPDAGLIFASGAVGTIEEAQQEVIVGVGVLAGSTTMILTVAWAGSLIAGRCDLSGPDNTAQDLTLTRGFDLFNTGVTTDEQTRWGAWIMMMSSVPYICAQVPLLNGNPAEGPGSALLGCILALSGLLTYFVYQVASPWLQKKQIEEARLQLLRSSALQGITSFPGNSVFSATLLLQEKAVGPSQGLLKEVFRCFDKNKDGKIEEDELRGLIVGLKLEQDGYIPANEQVETWLDEFDSDADGMLTENEFLFGITKWAHRVATERQSSKVQQLKKLISGNDPNFWAGKLEEAKKIVQLLESENDNADNLAKDGGETLVLDYSKLYKKSALFLASGAALTAIFADPLIDSIQGFSTASGIPPFFVAFVVVPFASNASELFSSILFATRRRKRNISLTFSQIYGSVTMNNTLCLGIFLGVVYTRGLTWDFSSEATIILLNILCIGTIGVSRTTFPLWYSIPVLSLYFMSLAGVAFLDYVLGWH